MKFNYKKGFTIVKGYFDNPRCQGLVSMSKLVTLTLCCSIASYQYIGAAGTNTYIAGSNNTTSNYVTTSTIIGDNNTVNKNGLLTPPDIYLVNNASVYGTSNTVEFDSDQSIDQATAIGYKNTITKFNDTAIGTANTLNGNTSVAVGVNNSGDSNAHNAVLVGSNNKAQNESTVLIGNGNKAQHVNTVLIGNGNNANQSNTVAVLGNSNTLSDSSGASVAVGNSTSVNGPSNVAIGYRSKTSGQSAIAIGLDSTANTFGIAIGGYKTTASGEKSIALGYLSNATAHNAITIGSNAESSVDNGVALGSSSIANRKTMTGAGTSSTASVLASTVYSSEIATAADKQSIMDTLRGTLGAVSVGSSTETRQIINVAAGAEDSDAVNVAQLKAVANTVTDTKVQAGKNVSVDSVVDGITTTYTISSDVGKQDISNLQNQITNNTQQIINNTQQISNNTNQINILGNRIQTMDSKINKVGAGAAALAGLYPLDFDADDKWNFAAGYGNYGDANAVALGAFYRPNEDTMFSIAGTMGNGESMISTGISLKLGQKNTVPNTRVALAKEVEDLKAIVKMQSVQIAQMQQQMNASTSVATKEIFFEDVPENHWAYEYVNNNKNDKEKKEFRNVYGGRI